MQKKLIFYVGTSAELIKLIPIMKGLETNGIKFKTVSSGQVDLKEKELDQIYKVSVTSRIFKDPKKISSVVFFISWFFKCFFYSLKFFINLKSRNYIVIVHGDTTSSLIGAICAKLSRLRVAHIESGLRSFNFLEPFPEEISRFLISKISDQHFCPNEWSVNNIKKESGEKINTFQNTSYEMLKMAKQLNKISLQIRDIKSKFFLTAIHRQENIYFKKDFLRNLIKEIVGFTNEDLKCVLVLHKITEQFLNKEGLLENLKNNPNVILLPRTPYIEFINTISNAEFMLTDGGSNQEEAFYLGIPTLILRNHTERIEGLGENITLMEGSIDKLHNFISNYKKYKRNPLELKIYPSEIIIDKLIKTSINELKWDSDFFGYKVGKIYLKENTAIDKSDIKDFRLIYIFDDGCDIKNYIQIEKLGAKLADTKMELEMKIEKKTHIDTNLDKKYRLVVLNKNDFNKETISLGIEAGKFSRFKKDINFKNNEFKKLYTKWVENSLNRVDFVEVYGIKYKSTAIGMVSLKKISAKEITISLIAVNENFQNQGLGTVLVSQAVEFCKSEGFDTLSVTTQEENINAMKFYQKLNFVIRKKERIYHLWN
jgi:UDP-N-acetylglucosamine 2-epimerase (non-hydrolysing)